MIALAGGVEDDSFVGRRCQRYLQWMAALKMIALADVCVDDSTSAEGVIEDSCCLYQPSLCYLAGSYMQPFGGG